MKSTRSRAFGLRGRNVPIAGPKEQAAGRSKKEMALSTFNQLTTVLPLDHCVLIPRNWSEGHNRPDSLCAHLGLPFGVVGPLLLAAGILAKNRNGSLSVSADGFSTLVQLYKRAKPSQKLQFVTRRPSWKWIKLDAVEKKSPTTNLYYICRGDKPPKYEYVPLVGEDIVVVDKTATMKIETKEKLEKATTLSESISEGFDSKTAAFFVSPQATQGQTLSVDTALSSTRDVPTNGE